MARPRIKFTVADYMTTPEDKRYQLLDGELVLAPAPTNKHQTIALLISTTLHQFVGGNHLGRVWFAPLDVILSNYDVVQPDILFVSNSRTHLITEANIQGAPDLVVEILSPATEQYDRGYKLTLYARHGVQEYWIVDPVADTVEVFTGSDQGLALAATYTSKDFLVSPLLAGLSIDLGQIFSAR